MTGNQRPMHEQHRPSLPIPLPTGSTRTCRTWDAEAAFRLLHNNLANAIAPEQLIVYGGTGRVARDWRSYRQICTALQALGPEETLCVQSGKPVYIGRTGPEAPRVIIANSNLVPRWATQQHFDELDRQGLMMYGQMTAGSWIYIGTQGIIQGTYETLAALAQKEFGQSDLAGKFVLTAGMGGMGAAQPLAGAMLNAAILVVEVRESTIARNWRLGFCDRLCTDLDEALYLLDEARREKRGLSVGLVGNAASVYPQLVSRGFLPDVVTDQTPAHDPWSYIPAGYDRNFHELGAEQGDAVSGKAYTSAVDESIRAHMRAMLKFQERGAVVFDYGNSLRNLAEQAGVTVRDGAGSFLYPGFVPAYIRPFFCEGKGPFRWVALSGEPSDIAAIDDVLLREFAHDESLVRWVTLAKDRVPFQGFPSRICWLGYGDRAKLGLIVNDMVARGDLAGPIAFGRDHLDCGSVASPTRETEAMLDGSDAVADWPLLNFALSSAGGASWVSFHSGGGVGVGLSLHAGQVIVADGTPERAPRLERVLTNDPGIGIARHVDAGYPDAIAAAEKHGISIPSLL